MKAHKWLVAWCKKGLWVAPNSAGTEELHEYRGRFISANFDVPGAKYETLDVIFWATKGNGRTRMLMALGDGAMAAEKLSAIMLAVQPLEKEEAGSK